MILRIGLAAVALAAGLAASPSTAERYRHQEFGFSVEIPRGFPTCVPDPVETQVRAHGLDIWLDGGPSGCGGVDTRPYISVTGDYNAGLDETPESVARFYCRPSRGKISAAPRGLSIKGKRTATCRIDETDGWIAVFVFTQAGKSRARFEKDAPAINYTLKLQTRPGRFETDLARFRAILKTFRLFAPEM